MIALKPQTHAERLIEVTKEYTVRPKKGDRAAVLIAACEYLLNNFAYDHESWDEDDCGHAGRYIDAEDVQDLVTQLKKLQND